MITAFLILKAHSERVPGKNFRDLGGRPLYRWILDALLATRGVGRVLVDTDARELLDQHGLPDDPRLILRDRDPALRGDSVTANALIAANLGAFGDGPVLMSHATSPFLAPDTLGAAAARFDSLRRFGQADSLFGVTRVQSRFWHAAGAPVNHDPQRLVPTQQLEPWFQENSSLYLFTAASFQATGSRIGARPALFETPLLESLDIDTEEEWALAELIARGLQRPSATPRDTPGPR